MNEDFLKEGWQAFKDGVKEDQNPYDSIIQADAFIRWKKGWDLAAWLDMDDYWFDYDNEKEAP